MLIQVGIGVAEAVYLLIERKIKRQFVPGLNVNQN